MIDGFLQRYGAAKDIHVYRAPGRVNLIGEHTDYNLGFVLPMALQMATFVATAPGSDGKLRMYSENLRESAEWPVAEIGNLSRQGRWTDYTIGVAQGLIRAGFEIAPQNLLIRSTVPVGSGLSSSAALEVSSALTLLGGRPLDPLRIAQLCQTAERDFVGLPCGIMDQYVSVFGKEHAAICIDCRSLTHAVAPLPDGVQFLAVNTMVKHELSSSAYKERTEQCATAVEIIRRSYPKVESLRDVTLEMFEKVEASLPELIARRARHVVSEDERVGWFMEAGRAGDLARMGELFEDSHRSLQHDYQVSCDELDFLVDAAMGLDGVYGARMTGGGFGGCTVNLMKPEAEGSFRRAITRLYRERFGLEPRIDVCVASAGAGEINNLESIPAPGQPN